MDKIQKEMSKVDNQCLLEDWLCFATAWQQAPTTLQLGSTMSSMCGADLMKSHKVADNPKGMLDMVTNLFTLASDSFGASREELPPTLVEKLDEVVTAANALLMPPPSTPRSTGSKRKQPATPQTPATPEPEQ